MHRRCCVVLRASASQSTGLESVPLKSYPHALKMNLQISLTLIRRGNVQHITKYKIKFPEFLKKCRTENAIRLKKDDFFGDLLVAEILLSLIFFVCIFMDIFGTGISDWTFHFIVKTQKGA